MKTTVDRSSTNNSINATNTSRALPAGAVFDEVEHGKPIDDDEVLAACLADTLHDRHRKSHPVFVAAAPFVFPGCLEKMLRP